MQAMSAGPADISKFDGLSTLAMTVVKYSAMVTLHTPSAKLKIRPKTAKRDFVFENKKTMTPSPWEFSPMVWGSFKGFAFTYLHFLYGGM